MDKREPFQLGPIEYALFAMLFFILPFGLEIRRYNPEHLVTSLWSFGYWIVFNSGGVMLEVPYWSFSSAFFVFLYYMGLQVVFVYALKTYFEGNRTKLQTQIIGMLSILPSLLPFLTGAAIVLLQPQPDNSFVLFLPFLFPVFFGFWLLRFKPSPLAKTWVEEEEPSLWWDKQTTD